MLFGGGLAGEFADTWSLDPEIHDGEEACRCWTACISECPSQSELECETACARGTQPACANGGQGGAGAESGTAGVPGGAEGT
jgi:hypothetical protein